MSANEGEGLAARLGLEQAAPRAEVLALLRRAVREATAARDEAQGRPWLDAATQRQLLEAWQRGLKPGSLVDAMDCDSKWYEGVVVCVKQQEEEEEEGEGGDESSTPGKGVVVRVSYRCWGPRFDEDIPLASLRVLPPYSVVPRWRDALAVGAHVEILSAASLATAAAASLELRPQTGVGGAAQSHQHATAAAAARLPERK